ncbi:hypothetical protein T4E_819, partial [Trichinella pseudospiralis]
LSRFARRSMDDRSLELLLRTTRCAIRQPTPVIGLTLPSKRFSPVLFQKGEHINGQQ